MTKRKVDAVFEGGGVRGIGLVGAASACSDCPTTSRATVRGPTIFRSPTPFA
jgi:hypothetical protein